MQIDLEFDVYKELTALRKAETHSYSDVVRGLLEMKGAATPTPSAKTTFKGVILKGVEFPEGTKFRSTYKGKTYTGEIKNGRWVDGKGKAQTSPSAAAFNITGSGVNGWWFWECCRPGDSDWTAIGDLRED